MIRIEKLLHETLEHSASISLPIDQRVKSRLKVRLSNGLEAGLFLPRGQVLRGGDLLQSTNGLVVKVLAAKERVSTVHCDDACALAQVSYHLGNRHVPLEISTTWVRYLSDHVLDEMIAGMGLAVQVELAPFEPEAGAYQSTTHNQHHHH